MSRQRTQAARLDTEAPEKPAGAFKLAPERRSTSPGVELTVHPLRSETFFLSILVARLRE